jgi:hypothetical protein
MTRPRLGVFLPVPAPACLADGGINQGQGITRKCGVHGGGPIARPSRTTQPPIRIFGVRAVKTIPSQSKRYTSGQFCRYVRPRFE